MMNYKSLIHFSCTVAMVSTMAIGQYGCTNPQRKIAGNYTFRTECMGAELDGSVTVKAWGNGRYRFTDAVDQAKKNVVLDVLFSGVTEGKQDCNPRPVLGEVNARMVHEDYFNAFFSDRGSYKKFVSTKDERIERRVSRERLKSREGVTFGLILRVDRPGLIAKMKEDGILK